VFAEHFDIGKDANMASVPVLNVGAEDKLRQIARLTGWYQLIAERLCVRDFQDVKKKHQGEQIFARVQKYRRGCHLAFFESDPLKQAELLYQAFKDDSHLSESAVEWQAKQKVQKPELVWKAVRDSAEYPWLQHVLSLETKARILIIKNGLEAALADATNEKMEKFWQAFEVGSLPSNFQSGFERLSASKYKHAIPYILQLYVELFGGFFVDDLDREQLASLAGQPVDAVTEALDLMDVFYPTSKGVPSQDAAWIEAVFGNCSANGLANWEMAQRRDLDPRSRIGDQESDEITIAAEILSALGPSCRSR
jgi:hypothetical protein